MQALAQLREEKSEWDRRRDRFIMSLDVDKLTQAEADLLREQWSVMRMYSDVLNKQIAAFESSSIASSSIIASFKLSKVTDISSLANFPPPPDSDTKGITLTKGNRPMEERPCSDVCVKCPQCQNEFKAMSKSDEESVKVLADRIQVLRELVDAAVHQVRQCQIHFAASGEGTTLLYEQGRTVIHKYQRLDR